MEKCSNLIKKLNTEYNCTSLVDIGCNSGLTSLIALINNFAKTTLSF